MTPDQPPAEEPAPEEWVLVFRVNDPDHETARYARSPIPLAPVPSRIKRLLKIARSMHLRCILVRCPTSAELIEAQEWM